MDTSKVIGIIAEQLGLSEAEISEETSFADLGADSFDIFQVISALEEEYGVTFDTDDTDKIKTVRNVIDYIIASVTE